MGFLDLGSHGTLGQLGIYPWHRDESAGVGVHRGVSRWLCGNGTHLSQAAA
jgi:hypothetical protein